MTFLNTKMTSTNKKFKAFLGIVIVPILGNNCLQEAQWTESMAAPPGTEFVHLLLRCHFTSFSTVFRSYQDDGSLIMEGCVKWNSV